MSISTRADLAGLGSSEGALVRWAIPANLTRTLRNDFAGAPPDQTGVRPPNAATVVRTAERRGPWLALVCLVCLAIFLVSRLKSNDKS